MKSRVRGEKYPLIKENKHIIKGNHQTKRQEKITKKIIENYKNNQKTMKKMTISTYLSIINLNVYRLNAIVKRHGMAKWIKNQKIKIPIYPALLETHFRAKDTTQT